MYSASIEITEGCAWNLCTFCWLYKDPRAQFFRKRSRTDIFKDLERIKSSLSFATNFFLGGSSAISSETKVLCDVLQFINQNFPHPQHISSYARASDILEKKNDELIKLHDYGLQTIYMGIETGSASLLKMCKKGITPEEIINASKKVMHMGFKLSVNVILGLGGKKFSKEHIIETTRILNSIKPHMIRFRTLHILPNSPLYLDMLLGIFKELRPREVLKEEYSILKELRVTSDVFNDHLSNYTNFCGSLPEEKNEMLSILENIINNPHKMLSRKDLTVEFLER
ncbi:radical SAM protein [Candidatus Borrarchaeum sp.]|uniref:radical SAM protein n=1 Tax=Candidatus Borrarchaeum sp. TaxID=2846742 RepID=UPI00257CB21F|nr:radical SAM protein [Candidatus Borrarchaeum sp.]